MFKRISRLRFLILICIIVVSCDSGEERKHFEGIKIVFFPGGTIESPYSKIMYNGARAAENDLGPKVEYMWSEWNPDKMLLQFKEAIDKNPDAICIMGHPGEERFRPLIEEAIRKGIIVSTQDISLPNIEKDYIQNGFGFVGVETYNAGSNLARNLIKTYSFRKGSRVLVWGKMQSGQGQRALLAKGAIDVMQKADLTVDYMEIDQSIESNLDLGYDKLNKYLKLHSDVKIILVCHAALTSKLPSFLKSAGYKPGDIIGAGFLVTPESIAGIKDGYMGVIQDVQPYLQGYLSVLQVSMAKKYGFQGIHIDTSSGFVNQYNVEKIEELMKQNIR